MLEESVCVCGRKKSLKPTDKDTWWWLEEVQTAVRKKKKAFKRMKEDCSLEAIHEYKNSKREAQQMVAIAKAKSTEKWYNELETKKSQDKVFRIAKARDRTKRDTGDVAVRHDGTGKFLTEESLIRKRRMEYFRQLLKTENDREEFEEIGKTEGPELEITLEEVKRLLYQMKKGKAAGPSEVTTKMFRALEQLGISWLSDWLNRLWREENIPEDWKKSTTIPIYNGNILECGSYRGIKLLEHGMKIYERILDRRLREVIRVDEMQCGFMPGKGTTGAIFVLR